jgi:hypothetical protein
MINGEILQACGLQDDKERVFRVTERAFGMAEMEDVFLLADN